ncbi:hypothetical protein L1987_39669 [Smallanthus sonchifolius]|uniref:Uncharacterized protein n=1 Tax=Smallanthus sonchifolius TaxID=185202 RepID=A0ACB9HMY0_9ASTR|nr:hypothetical protein L1987_39669 [Smallanthus sonchifolius]
MAKLFGHSLDSSVSASIGFNLLTLGVATTSKEEVGQLDVGVNHKIDFESETLTEGPAEPLEEVIVTFADEPKSAGRSSIKQIILKEPEFTYSITYLPIPKFYPTHFREATASIPRVVPIVVKALELDGTVLPVNENGKRTLTEEEVLKGYNFDKVVHLPYQDVPELFNIENLVQTVESVQTAAEGQVVQTIESITTQDVEADQVKEIPTTEAEQTANVEVQQEVPLATEETHLEKPHEDEAAKSERLRKVAILVAELLHKPKLSFSDFVRNGYE